MHLTTCSASRSQGEETWRVWSQAEETLEKCVGVQEILEQRTEMKELQEAYKNSKRSSAGHLQQQFTLVRELRRHNLQAEQCLAPCVSGVIAVLYDDLLVPAHEAPSMGTLDEVNKMRLQLEETQKKIREAGNEYPAFVEVRNDERRQLNASIGEAVEKFDVLAVHNELKRLQVAEECLKSGMEELGTSASLSFEEVPEVAKQGQQGQKIDLMQAISYMPAYKDKR